MAVLTPATGTAFRESGFRFASGVFAARRALAGALLLLLAAGAARTAAAQAASREAPPPGPGALRVYTEDARGHRVIALDGDTGEVIARIPVDRGPHDIALCAQKALLFTGNIDGSTVSVIDARTNTVVRTLPAGAGAHGVGVSPDCSRLYVANAYADTVTVFEIEGFRRLADIPVGRFPEYAAAAPDGSWALSTNLGGRGSVTEIDPRALAARRTFRLGVDPHGWALSPDGTRLLVANLGSDRVYLLDARSLETLAAFDTGARSEWAAFRSDREVWVTNIGADYVSVINLEEGKIVDRIRTGRAPHGIGFSADGRWAFVSNMEEGTVVKIDAAARRLVASIPVGGELHNLAVWTREEE